MATESISSLNPLFFLDYGYLNGLLKVFFFSFFCSVCFHFSFKKRGRTKEQNVSFLRLFKSELLRVNETFQETLGTLTEAREEDNQEPEVLKSVWQRCVLLEEFASSNKKAALRVADRFDWLVSGAQASGLISELDVRRSFVLLHHSILPSWSCFDQTRASCRASRSGRLSISSICTACQWRTW